MKDKNDVLNLFKIIDGFMTLLKKNKRFSRVESLLSLVNNYLNNSNNTLKHISLNYLRFLTFIAPDLLQFEYVHQEKDIYDQSKTKKIRLEVSETNLLSYNVGSVEYFLEIKFIKYVGTSTSRVNKRFEYFKSKLQNLSTLNLSNQMIELPRRPGLDGSIGSLFSSITVPDAINSSASKFDPNDTIKLITDTDFYKNQICFKTEFEGGKAEFSSLSRPLHPTLSNFLNRKKLSLYSHQAKALDFLRSETEKTFKCCLVSTSTSSGKSLIYLLSILEELITNPESKALLIFPTKALAYDQLGKIRHILSEIGLEPNLAQCFDGDTDFSQRNLVINKSNILISNPDMLHFSILPNFTKFKQFFINLKHFLVDEAHVYSGVFGANVSLIFRRFIRLFRYFSSEQLKIICCSATINNPIKHFKKLILNTPNMDIALINASDDKSPKGKRTLCFWRPPLFQNSKNSNFEEEKRLSPIFETAKLTYLLLKLNVRTLVFARTRKLAELILNHTIRLIKQNKDNNLLNKVAAYRGGYTKKERRDLERRMFNNELIIIIATNALELGIDIGTLSCVITVGFPNKTSSFIQQIGRCGRNGEKSLIFIICFNSLLDNYFILNPYKYIKFKLKDIYINYINNNLNIFYNHLLCASYELPILIDFNKNIIFDTFFESSLNDDREEEDGDRDKRILFYVKKMITKSELSYFAKYLPKSKEIKLFKSSSQKMKKYSVNKLSYYLNNLLNNNLINNNTQTGNDKAKERERELSLIKLHGRLKVNDIYKRVKLRSIDEENITLVVKEYNNNDRVINNDNGRVIDNISYSRCLYELYPGNIYLHQNKYYLINKLDLINKISFCQLLPSSTLQDNNYFTSSRDITELYPIKLNKIKITLNNNVHLYYGKVKIKTTLIGYWKINIKTKRKLSYHQTTLPSLLRRVHATWLMINLNIIKYINIKININEICHSINHLIKNSLPVTIEVDMSDIDTRHHFNEYSEKGGANNQIKIIIYEKRAENIGIAKYCFDNLEQVMKICLEIIRNCECLQGCKGCVLDVECKYYNKNIGQKKQTIQLLEKIIEEISDNKLQLKVNNKQNEQLLIEDENNGKDIEFEIDKAWSEQDKNKPGSELVYS